MEFRHEQKYIINTASYALVCMRLKAVMQHDRYANADGVYTVRSLYFDDFLNTAYNDKSFGAIDRQKFRIRIYNHSPEVIHLERKIKKGDYIAKQTASLSRPQAEAIIQGEFGGLCDCENPLLLGFYHECRSKMLRPRVIVDYEREPFIMRAGNVRITFDQHVRVGVDGWDIFNPDMAVVNLLEPSYLVMEVKYGQFMPSVIQELLPRFPNELTAVSKFVMGCDQTLYKRLFDN